MASRRIPESSDRVLNAPPKKRREEPVPSNDYPEGTIIRVRKADGVRMWYLDGVLHRAPDRGPAIENPDGTGVCYVKGKPHGEVWEDEVIPLVEEKPAAVKVAPPAPPKPKAVVKQRMSFSEFQLLQERNKAAENNAQSDSSDDEPTLADLSKLFKANGFRAKSKHRRH